MKTFKEICDLSFKDYLEEIISGDDFKAGTNYKNKFMSTFDGDKYKEIVSQLTGLFKKLNNGKLKKSVMFDLKGNKKKLTKSDNVLIQLLFDLGYTINKEMYKTGIAKRGNKDIKILDILKGYQGKNIESMKKAYNKSNNIEIKKQMDFIDNLVDLKILNKGKIDIRKLSIYDNKGMKIVFTYDHRAIASQSTKVGWTSCMNLDKSSDYSDNVGSGTSDGVFIAYLTKADDTELKNPTARVLFKPYKGRKTNNIFWKADKIYGTASNDFITNAQKIIDKAQGKPKADIYDLTKNTYRDNLKSEIEIMTKKDMDKIIDIALNNKDDYNRYYAIKKLTDQKILGQVALNDKDDYNRRLAIENLTDQKILGHIALNDKDDDNRSKAIEKLTDKDILQNIIDKDDSRENVEYAKRILGHM